MTWKNFKKVTLRNFMPTKWKTFNKESRTNFMSRNWKIELESSAMFHVHKAENFEPGNLFNKKTIMNFMSIKCKIQNSLIRQHMFSTKWKTLSQKILIDFITKK